MKWVYYEAFDKIPPHILYGLLKLRQDVFIIEQDCIYEDIDNLDQHSSQLVLSEADTVIGCARLVPPGVKYPELSIGRIAVSSSYRNRGIGKELVERAIGIAEKSGQNTIRIEAQTYLLTFYESLGFEADGDEYILDGIPHVEMIRVSMPK
ncbi:GNAT family N-acetyltransferase [Rhodohalobacter mucosus]|uniref:GNAT family N-acetyltransferase n=2 Tax=Rhodohalobacter mucosus TaxID=2079485 RepID=A0A316TUU3_9BACT|nr:GNAT family N-acetyltransferase [Rhodohalobacter mucosus]